MPLITTVQGMSIFAWLFISFGLLFRFKRAWMLLFGIIDLGLILTVAVGAGFQGNYLPATLKGCRNADRWQTQGNTPSFFSRAADLKGGKSTPGRVCREFVTNWGIAVSVIIFHMLTAYIGIFFDEREFSILNPYRPLINFILVVFGVPYGICNWIWNWLTPRVLFGYRCVLKFGRRMRGLEKLEFEEPRPYMPRYGLMLISNPKLHEILTIEHVLLELVNNLHYEDVINLSLTSKSVREAVFPGRDLVHRVPKLRKYCCDKDSKKACLYCNKKICKDCEVMRYLPGLAGRRHVTWCKPYCSKCYFKQFSQHPWRYKKPCRCRLTDASFEYQDMCHTCSIKETVGMQKARHKRYQQEARDLAIGTYLGPDEKVKCGGCKNELKTGTRWWVCGRCKRECRDAIHPAWIGKRMGPDLEKGEETKMAREEKLESTQSKWKSM
ncbi:hypothetical protein K469DRAFT_256094 [Zopfia rhizophila CBS 207.26]|uniref:Uncharacterized protein n=1 Tax=Zopfia rhizophila CBS 207.26 TaxID=1314779 RepID=A0A6A6DRP9_9PEZI|nr:hypothetical protein K469DRAFT_256094 [Zopfia rhizophila CBS 207.26]